MAALTGRIGEVDRIGHDIGIGETRTQQVRMWPGRELSVPMADVFFTPNLRRHVDCPVESIDATTVRELFDRYFEKYPAVQGYVLDDQGHVRHHVKIIVDGLNVRDRSQLSDALEPASQVHVFQALSGG